MAKPFKTLDQQIAILKNRGLIIKDENKIEKLLCFTNYYNVINCYSKYFQKDTDVYINSASFEEVMSVYYFDEEIKNVLFKNIIEVEKSFKSVLSYVFSEAHRESYSYLNIQNFDCNRDLTVIANMIANIARVIRSNSKEKTDNAIKHYIKNHNEIPLWVLINFMDFGLTLHFYHCMKKGDQNRVAKIFGENISEIKKENIVLDSAKLFRILNNVREVRNIVAHNNKLLDFCCRNNLPYIDSLYKVYDMNPNEPRQNVFSVIVAMQIFMSEEAYKNFINSIKNRIKKLERNLVSIEYKNVVISLGIPNDWLK